MTAARGIDRGCLYGGEGRSLIRWIGPERTFDPYDRMSPSDVKQTSRTAAVDVAAGRKASLGGSTWEGPECAPSRHSIFNAKYAPPPEAGIPTGLRKPAKPSSAVSVHLKARRIAATGVIAATFCSCAQSVVLFVELHRAERQRRGYCLSPKIANTRWLTRKPEHGGVFEQAPAPPGPGASWPTWRVRASGRYPPRQYRA
jgi:hypothetical protein